MTYRMLESLILLSGGGAFGVIIGIEPVIGSVLFLGLGCYLRS